MIKFTSYLLIFLALIENSFFSYFGRHTNSSDIYLFFTHISETFETFFEVSFLFITPFIFFILSTIFLKFIFKYNSYLFLILIIYLNFSSFYLIDSIGSFFIKTFSFKQQKFKECRELKEVDKKDINIVLIVGESLRSDKVFNHLTPNLNKLNSNSNFISKEAISGAINTDVAIPLLLNSSTNPLKIDKCKNLFKLAKNANFNTAFISTQSIKALKYIDEYLSREYIDFYRDSGDKKLYDEVLLENLQEINLKESNFIVLQLYGEHSPYLRYPKEFEKFKDYSNLKSKLNSHYNNSLIYTDFILNEIVEFFTKEIKPTYIIFTSDHGEFLGENGKYGHNQFDELIYKVPFFIYSNDVNILNKFNSSNLITHNEISKFITFLFGYEREFKLPKDKEVIVNGTMINREDGYLKLQIKEDKIVQLIKEF